MTAKETFITVVGMILVAAVISVFIAACHLGLQHTRELKTHCIDARGNWTNGDCRFYK